MRAAVRFPRTGSSAIAMLSIDPNSEKSTPELGMLNPHISHLCFERDQRLSCMRLAYVRYSLINTRFISIICPYADSVRGGGRSCNA